MRRLALLTIATAVVYALLAAPFLAGGLADSTVPAGAIGAFIQTGAWRVDHAGLRDVRVDAPPPARLSIDGQVVSEQFADAAATRTIWLAAGYHAVAIERSGDSAENAAGFVQGTPGGELVEPSRSDLARAMPGWSWLWTSVARLANLARLLFWISSAALVIVAIRRVVRRGEAGGPDPIKQAQRQRWSRRLAITACVAIVTFGALLRIDGITSAYGPVQSPRWLGAAQLQLQRVMTTVTPATWNLGPAPTYQHADGVPTRYRSDPYTYLKFAREMRWFYGAHFREPVFPFATKVWLWALRNQDVAVSFTSVTFSVIALVMTYLVGSLAFGRPVGLAATLLLAIERDVVGWDIAGWRDTAFMCAVLVVVHALLRFRRSPMPINAAWLGAAAGLACLVRITSLSFALPALASILFVWTLPRRERAGPFAIAALAMAVVLGPYLFNCWRVYGDPLYAINVHTSVYQTTEGAARADVGAVAYIESKLLKRPAQTIETGVYGLTAYPFLNKWGGFWHWWPPLVQWLSWAAILGLLAWCFWRDGRLLLAILACSLLPFAFTWTLIGDWRFTEHAYPFYLLAACAAVAIVVEFAIFWRPTPVTRADRRSVIAGASLVAGVVMLALAFTWGMPVLTAREALRAGEDVSIATGARDATLFRSGWSSLFGSGNVTMRVMTDDAAVVWIPLPDPGDFAITLRADPFPAPAAPLPPERIPSLTLSINGVALPPVALQFTPGRVGAYRIALPRASLRRGDNRLDLRFVSPTTNTIRGLTEASTAAVWYVRVHPPAK